MQKSAISISVLCLAIFGLGASVAKADSVAIATSRSGFNDTAAWTSACTHGLASVSSTSANGVTITATDATGGIANDIQSAPGCSYGGWNGNFAPGDSLLYTGSEFTTGAGNGPITLDFSNPVAGVGTQIQYGAAFTDFTAEIAIYDGSTLLGTFFENGVSNNLANNSAIFLGAMDASGANITSAVISVVGSGDFAINQVSLVDAPEPSSILLLSVGLAALLGVGVMQKQRGRCCTMLN